MRKNEIKGDLRTLSMLLKKWTRVSNPDILGQLSVIEGRNNTLEYTLEKSNPLIFKKIDFENHSLPSGIEKLLDGEQDIQIELCIRFSEFEVKPTQIVDPIDTMGVSIKIHGDYYYMGKIQSCICSWHLDRHKGNSDYCHPIYHLNFGGKNMIEHSIKNRDYFGNLLLLPSPRIVHPPLDIILSCDFIIRNFYKKQTHTEITRNPAYLDLIKRATFRYWKPFFFAINSNWEPFFKTDNLCYNDIIDYN